MEVISKKGTKNKVIFDWIIANLQIIPYQQREDPPDLNIRSVWAFKILGEKETSKYINLKCIYL